MNALRCLVVFLIGGGPDRSTRWDFKVEAVGKLPVGWTVAQTGNGQGVWKIVEAADAPGKSGKALAQTGADKDALFNLCVADKNKFKDLDLSVAFQAQAGEVDQGGGPVWRYQDNKNYYIARMNPLENNFRLYKVVAGKRVQLASAAAKGAAGVWHTVRIVHKGDRIECFFNGKKELEVTDDQFLQAGKIGLWTKADAQTLFADVRVQESTK